MTWHFLRAGQSSGNAISSLDALLQQLSNVADYNTVIAANRYLMWVETAETQLRAHFEDQAVWRALHTERFWRIREMTGTTLRPAPLIEGEMADQRHALEGLREQLLHYQRMLAAQDDEQLLVLDTNVLIHGTLFTQVRWNQHVPQRRVRLVMPLVVLDELDAQKNKGNRAAGAVLRELDAILRPQLALARTDIREKVTLQVIDEPTAHERIGNADDEIVHQVGYFASHCDGRISIVTMDRAMRVRAEAAGIAALMLPADLSRSEE